MTELAAHLGGGGVASVSFPPSAAAAPAPEQQQSALSSQSNHHQLQQFSSFGAVLAPITQPDISSMAAPVAAVSSDNPQLSNVAKTPNLQSNMFKMQRNRSTLYI